MSLHAMLSRSAHVSLRQGEEGADEREKNRANRNDAAHRLASSYNKFCKNV